MGFIKDLLVMASCIGSQLNHKKKREMKHLPINGAGPVLDGA